jgi:non-heme chloroperoxidase
MPRITNRDGVELFVHDWGSGPTLVFIHGGALNADCWEYQTVPLSDRHRCVAIDTRGCGRSDEPADGYDYDSLADDIDDVLCALEIDDAVLVGHSMGAGSIVRYFTRHGGARVRGVVLVAPVTPFMLLTEDHPHGVPASVFEESVELLRSDRPLWIDAAAPMFFGDTDEVSDSMLAWGKSLALGSGAIATIKLFDSFYRTDFRSELVNVTVPTLVCHGDADRTAPIELTGRPTAAGIPDATLEVYAGGSHGLFLSHARKLTTDIATFADGVGAVVSAQLHATPPEPTIVT